MKLHFTGSLLAMVALMPAAHAHITLAVPHAAIGSYYKAVLQVAHGCQGSDTLRIRVRIPDGVLAVKPQPKPGWDLHLIQGDYATPQTLHGAQLERGVREIDWRGELPDAWYDEFVFRAYLSPTLQAGQTVYFPVVQECRQGVERWIDTTGKPDADAPAPGLKLSAPAADAASHHGHGPQPAAGTLHSQESVPDQPKPQNP